MSRSERPSGQLTVRRVEPRPVERLVLPEVLLALSHQQRVTDMAVMEVLQQHALKTQTHNVHGEQQPGLYFTANHVCASSAQFSAAFLTLNGSTCHREALCSAAASSTTRHRRFRARWTYEATARMNGAQKLSFRS